MNTLYVRCQTKDYILDIVAARAGMRINKVNSVGFLTIGESRYRGIPGVTLVKWARVLDTLL